MLFLKNLCLKPSYSLRWQLLLSFGSSTFLCLTLILIISVIVSLKAGLLVQERAGKVMRTQVEQNLAQTTRFTSEAFTESMSHVDGVAQMVAEFVMDRIVGYPRPGWQDDTWVPFYDILSQRNVYPLQNDPLPFDWNITLDVTEENAREMLQERAFLIKAFESTSTLSSASFFMSGSCNPDTNLPPGSPGYVEGCAPEISNNVTRHSPTTAGLYQKSGDIGVLLRPLFEARPDILLIGMYYVNSGAGAATFYPGHILSNDVRSYESTGCDWMREMINPYTNAPYGTEEDIQRCQPTGTQVQGRFYNPLERQWFQEFVKGAGKVVWYGPFQASGGPIQTLSIGKAVYDRETKELIGCVRIDIPLTLLNQKLKTLEPVGHFQVAIMDYESGDLVANSEEESISEDTPFLPRNQNLTDIGITPEQEIKDSIKSRIEQVLQDGWTNETIEDSFSMVVQTDLGILTSHPLPVPPKEYDPNYKPKYIVLQASSDSIFSPIVDFEQLINDDIKEVACVTTAIGILGLIVTLAIVWCVARMITQPLLWIESISHNIINHTTNKHPGVGIMHDDDDRSLDLAMARWSPNTEVMDLVASFKKMIEGFSGEHPPSVAENDIIEVKNTITWQSDFCQLYEKGLDAIKAAVHSNTSAATPQTEAESQEQDAGLGRKQAQHSIMTKQDASNSSPVFQSDFIPNFHRNGDPAGTRKLSFVAGNSRALDSMKPVSVVPAPPKQNLGRNLKMIGNKKESLDKNSWLWVSRSKLFRWILLLLVTPLVLATAIILVLVTINIVSTVPNWVDYLAEESLELSKEALVSVTRLKTTLVEEILSEPVRDIHTLSRVANWIHAGAIPVANSFTEVDYSTEQCKTYDVGTCPVYSEPGRFPCPCEWDDSPSFGNRTCTAESPRGSTRPLQKRFYACQRKGDFNPYNGERVGGSRIVLAKSPAETNWWGNVSELPGAVSYDTNPSAATTYSRVRTSSAFSVVEFPIYNYATALGRSKHHIGTFTAYEADGLFTGFGGCTYNHPNYAHFVSNNENHAAKVRPLLCPLGEHGFDPRCRPWYEETKRDFFDNSVFVHITAPYPFINQVNEPLIGLSAVSPILFPLSRSNIGAQTIIGEVLLDFLPNGLWEAFESIERPVSFMVARKEDLFGGDTVIPPDRSKGWSSAKISDLLMNNDAEKSAFRHEFDELLSKMKNGGNGTTSFHRTCDDGESEELTMSYFPVNHRFVRPIDPSDISRGVEVVSKQLYSLAVAAYDDDMNAPFRVVKDEMIRDLKKLAIVDVGLTVFLALIFIAFAFRISIHATKPMIVLLKAVESINSGDAENDIQALKGGSREFSQVYTSFSKLNKIVGISNKAFFSGSLDWAYHFIHDALELFRKVDDQKAIGVACNNLGNTIFAMAIQGQPLWILNKRDGPNVTVQTALDYYAEAIEICRRDFDQAQESDLKAEYAQHLADRHFNRGLYLLFVEGEPDAPQDARNLAFADIARTRDLDYDVRDFFIEKKLLFDHSEEYFCRLLRRIFGLSAHCQDQELRDLWNVRDLIQDADSFLFAAWSEPSVPVFRELGKVNRLQQLESAALRLELCEGNTAEAARMGMRMLAEDEYILECAFPIAANAILHSMRSDDGLTWSRSTCLSFKNDLRSMASTCRNAPLDLGKCVVFALELNERWEGGPLLEKAKAQCLRIFDHYCQDDDHIGVAAYTVRGDQTVSLQSKALNLEEQRAMLDVATTSTSEMVSPSLPFAMQMIVDSSATLEKDTYVLLLTDGYSWDTESYFAIRDQIEKLNRERKTSIHLIIIGFDIEEEEVVDECRAMCTVSKCSFFVEVTLENVDAVFGSVIGATKAIPFTGQCERGITMEKF